jgi:thiol-disulfide isomerase/thioredoxin
MLTTTTVVSPARFSEGLSYADFLSQATINHDKFNESYETAPLSEEDISFFRKASALPHGLAKILALGEPWCGDVYRELPTIARIAEATGIELRVFLRDQNPDIMDEFLSNEGKSRAIPVFVFYTDDLQYITRFTERSASAHAGLAKAMDEVKVQLNLPPETTFGTVPDAHKAVFLKEVIARIQPNLNQWRKDAIAEIRELLSTALGIPNAG